MAVPGVPRSQRLLAWDSNAGPGSPNFTCPADHVTLVKSFHAINRHTADAFIDLVVSNASGSIQVSVFHFLMTSGSTFEWDGLIILHPGEYLYTYAGQVGVAQWCSGSILRGGPTFPPAELADPLEFPPVVIGLPAPS